MILLSLALSNVEIWRASEPTQPGQGFSEGLQLVWRASFTRKRRPYQLIPSIQAYSCSMQLGSLKCANS
jgi:hypothetical protein